MATAYNFDPFDSRLPKEEKLSKEEKVIAGNFIDCFMQLKKNKDEMVTDQRLIDLLHGKGDEKRSAWKKMMLRFHADKLGPKFKDLPSEDVLNLSKLISQYNEQNFPKILKAAEYVLIQVDPDYKKLAAPFIKTQDNAAKGPSKPQASAPVPPKAATPKTPRNSYAPGFKQNTSKFGGILDPNVASRYATKQQYFSNFAQDVSDSTDQYKSKRTVQINHMDSVKAQLSSSGYSDNEKAALLYAAMDILMQQLKGEFRWTRWLGTKSRLESILKEDMKSLEKSFPNVKKESQTVFSKIIEKIIEGAQKLFKTNKLG